MMRLFFLLICLGVGGVSAFFAQPYAHENGDAIVIIVTVLTVFAGFLVAIVVVLGDPSLIPQGSWRIAESRRADIESRLVVHIWLFVFYLVAIGLLFVGSLVGEAADVSLGWKVWIERVYLFFGITSFLFTFALPSSLLKFQLARIDAEIERRRADAGIAKVGDGD